MVFFFDLLCAISTRKGGGAIRKFPKNVNKCNWGSIGEIPYNVSQYNNFLDLS